MQTVRAAAALRFVARGVGIRRRFREGDGRDRGFVGQERVDHIMIDHDGTYPTYRETLDSDIKGRIQLQIGGRFQVGDTDPSSAASVIWFTAQLEHLCDCLDTGSPHPHPARGQHRSDEGHQCRANPSPAVRPWSCSARR